MDKQSWFEQELKNVQDEVKKWPKWKLGETDKEENGPIRRTNVKKKVLTPRRP